MRITGRRILMFIIYGMITHFKQNLKIYIRSFMNYVIVLITFNNPIKPFFFEQGVHSYNSIKLITTYFLLKTWFDLNILFKKIFENIQPNSLFKPFFSVFFIFVCRIFGCYAQSSENDNKQLKQYKYKLFTLANFFQANILHYLIILDYSRLANSHLYFIYQNKIIFS